MAGKQNRHRTLKPRAVQRRLSRRSSNSSSADFLSRSRRAPPMGALPEKSVDKRLEKDGNQKATNNLAAEAAETKKDEFNDSINTHTALLEEEKDCVAPFELDEINTGTWLGSGEYSDIYEIQSFRISTVVDETATSEESGIRDSIKRCETYRQTGKARYAIKHLKEEFLVEHDQSQYIQAASDLALEAELLSRLSHPHIIKIRGANQSGSAGFTHGATGFFIIIDRLFDTLDKRIKKWRADTKSKNKIPFLRRASTSLSRKKQKDLVKDMDTRLSVALQIAAGMKYLHENSILHRDIKPCNIGFDVRGDVKIFDFGLACVVPGESPHTDVYEMSGAGSPRYMAPEVLTLQAYNLKADVYSFAVVLWEILSTQIPFANIRTRDELIDHIVMKKARPPINGSWPALIKGMLESSFDTDIEKRPRMELYYDVIREQLSIFRGGDDIMLSDTFIQRRRSHTSLRSIELNL